MKKYILIQTAILMAVLAMVVPAFCVVVPHTSAISPNSRFLYSPDMTLHRIRVIDTSMVSGAVNITSEPTQNNANESSIIQTLNVTLEPYCMVVNKAGTVLFATLAQTGSPYVSSINAYTIGGNGKLTLSATYSIADLYAMPRGAALTASENYLYVTDYVATGTPAYKKIRRIKINYSAGQVSSMTQDGYVTVEGTSAPFGVAITPDGTRMYISNIFSSGTVMVYDISTENNPVRIDTITNCPYASNMKITPDGTKLLVRINEKVSPYSDVRVFNTSNDSLYANLSIPNPGNHQIGVDNTGPNGYPDGYDDNPSDTDENMTNYESGLALSPDGKYVYYNHYTKNPGALLSNGNPDINAQNGVSGDGMWHWNTKIRIHDLTNPSNSWEGNAGSGLHSADSVIVAPNGRIWTFYSDGNWIQATALTGPTWVAHYLVTSTEATITWATVESATQYQYCYDQITSPTGIQTFETTSPIVTLEGLTPMTTYEVRVRAQVSSGDWTNWTPIQYTTGHQFYTLETVWLQAYGIQYNSAYVRFGPVKSTGVKNVPFADHYMIQYRVSSPSGTNPWTTQEVTTTSASDTNDATHLTYQITGLTANTTYEAIMWTVDATGHPSDLSATYSFYTNPFYNGPVWCNVYNLTSNEAVVDWGTVEGATAYTITYKMTQEANWSSPITVEGNLPKYNPGDINPNYLLTGLNALSSYEVVVNALKYDGTSTVESLWTPPATFYTLERPWVDFYNPGVGSFYVTWGPEINTGEVTVPLSSSYQMQYLTNEAIGWQNASETLNNSSHADPSNLKLNILFNNLTFGISYEVRVRTVDIDGRVSKWGYIGGGDDNGSNGPYGTTWEPVFTIPAPAWIAAINISGEAATLIWDPTPATYTGHFIRYEYSYGTDASGESNGTHIPDGGTASTIDTIEGLTPFTDYYAKVRAVYDVGISTWTVPVLIATVPGPAWNSNYNTTYTQTNLTWEAVSGVASYEVQYGISAETIAFNSFSPDPGTDPSNRLNYGGPIYGLNKRTWYVSDVRAFYNTPSALVSNWSADNKFYTIPAPSFMMLTDSTNTSLSLTWEAVEVDDSPITWCSSYEVNISLTPEVLGAINVFSSTPYTTVTGLMPGQEYYVQVRAIDSDSTHYGWSSWAPYPPMLAIPTNEATITALQPYFGYRGSTVKIDGSNFGSVAGWITFETSTGTAVPAQVSYWTNTEIGVSVPPTALAGNYLINIMKPSGVVAGHFEPGAPYSYSVQDGYFVLDDFEGGVWTYSSYVAALGNSVNYTPNYTNPLQGATDMTVNCTGNSSYEILGGVSPYGAATYETGVDISQYKTLSLSLKNNSATTIVATFELVESNMAPGNSTSNPLAAEVWKSMQTIVMPADGQWHSYTLNLSTEGVNPFVRDSNWWTDNRGPSYSQLSLDMIKAFQLMTSSINNPKSYSIDYVVANLNAPLPGTVTNEMVQRVADTKGSQIMLKWDYASVPGPVDIYTQTGTFDTIPNHWVLQNANFTGTSTIDVLTTVGDGQIKWYKIVRSGTTLSQAMISSGVLGKWDYNLNVGNNLVSLPFVPFNSDLNVVIGQQLTAGSPFSGGSDLVETLINGVYLDSALTAPGWTKVQLSSLEADRGYYIIIADGNPAKTITVCGKTTPSDRLIPLIGGGENLIGTCYPVPVPLNSSNLAQLLRGGSPFDGSGDTVQEYDNTWNAAVKDLSTGLFRSTSLFNFRPGFGYYVSKQVPGDVIWDYPKTY